MPAIFQPQIAKNNQPGTLSQGNSNLSDHRLLLRDSHKGIDHALTPDESLLPKIIFIKQSPK